MEFWGDGKGKDLGSSPTLFIKYLKWGNKGGFVGVLFSTKGIREGGGGEWVLY